MRISVINTGMFKLDGGAMHGVVPKSIWNKINPADENNLCTWAMRCLLIEEGDKLVLIDTGIGNKQDQNFTKHYFLHGEDSLKSSIIKNGYHPDEITDVILTHLHFDHCGGALEYEKSGKIVPTFKNAKYWSNEKHWDWAVNPNPREKASFLKENLLPLKESGQLHFISDNFLFPFLEIIYVDGHTEKQMLPVIHHKEKKIAYAADLIPSIGHIKLPYVMSYDVRPLLTMQEKEVFLSRAYHENFLIFFEHDPKVEACTVSKTEKGFVADSVQLADFL